MLRDRVARTWEQSSHTQKCLGPSEDPRQTQTSHSESGAKGRGWGVAPAWHKRHLLRLHQTDHALLAVHWLLLLWLWSVSVLCCASRRLLQRGPAAQLRGGRCWNGNELCWPIRRLLGRIRRCHTLDVRGRRGRGLLGRILVPGTVLCVERIHDEAVHQLSWNLCCRLARLRIRLWLVRLRRGAVWIWSVLKEDWVRAKLVHRNPGPAAGRVGCLFHRCQ
eukprot:2654858-Rhodomonas_salina.3